MRSIIQKFLFISARVWVTSMPAATRVSTTMLTINPGCETLQMVVYTQIVLLCLILFSCLRNYSVAYDLLLKLIVYNSCIT